MRSGGLRAGSESGPRSLMSHDATVPAGNNEMDDDPAPGNAPEVLSLRAFTADGHGGNPAGVVLDSGVEVIEADMLAIAARVGHSETVFVTDGPVTAGRRDYSVRYFSPDAEVPFCGHATIALGAALAARLGPGDITVRTAAGPVALQVAQDRSGIWTTTLRNPAPRSGDRSRGVRRLPARHRTDRPAGRLGTAPGRGPGNTLPDQGSGARRQRPSARHRLGLRPGFTWHHELLIGEGSRCGRCIRPGVPGLSKRNTGRDAERVDTCPPTRCPGRRSSR